MVKYYKGLNCLTDMDSEQYTEYGDISQEEVVWAEQSVYALYSTYFGVVLLFLFIIRKLLYLFNDFNSRYSDSKVLHFKIIDKLTASSRFLAYKRLPLIFSRLSRLPASFGTLFLLFSSTLYLLCYTFIPHFWYRGCHGFGTPPLAQRAGMLVMGMTPFLIVMSGKTNVISGVTGVSYEKLNVFHQALGWGSLFLSLVHTFPFIIQDSLEGGIPAIHDEWESDSLYRNGVPPLVFLFVMCFMGLSCVRKHMYEIFWHCHWILGLAYFGTLAWHVYGAMGIEYIWATLGFWGAQMIYRIIIKSPFKLNTYSFKHKEANIKILQNNSFEVIIPIKQRQEFFWKPGQHILIRFMQGIHTLDNHPFSIMTIPKPTGESNLKLIVRAQKGLTKKIYDYVLNENNLEKKYKVYIDGAYGGMNRDSLSFNKLILVASGSGIAVTLPFMLNVAQHLGNPSNNVQSIEFTWIIRNIDSLESVKDQLIELFNLVINYDEKYLSIFTINIFVTNSSDGENPEIITLKSQLRSNSDNEIHSESSKLSLNTVTDENYKNYVNIYENQKPSLKTYVADTQLYDRTAVIVCGTSSCQIDVGNAASELQKQVLKGEAEEVYLHTENFGW